MNKNSTLFQLKMHIALLLLCIAVVGQALAQKQGSDEENKMTPDSVLKKIKLQERHVNTWFSTTKKIKNIEGSSIIYNEDVTTTPVSDLTNVIAGRLPGLYSSKSSGRTGPMYDASSLTLRGQTPLIVIDGVVRSFTSFNVDDIKSITVLNDALANSMFGLRSGNGVIYITTKDRSIEKPFELGFSAQYGAIGQFKRPNFITGANYAKLYNEAQQNTFPGATPAYSSDRIAALENGTNDPYTNPNNDWYNTIYKKNSAQQRYAINASGNGKNYRFYTSVEHFTQDGNFLTNTDNPYNTDNYYKRYNLRTNAQIDFNEDIQLGLNIFGSVENSNEPGAGASTIMSRIFNTSPLEYPARNANGSFGGNTSFTTNILASTISTGYIQYNERSLSADVFLKFKLDDIAKGLWTKALLSINNYYLQRISRTKAFAIYYPNATNDYTKVGSDGVIEAGAGTQEISSQYKQTYFNGLIGYDKNFGKHGINLLATYNLTNLIDSYSQLNQIYQTAGLRANYNYNEKYLAEIALSYSGFNRYVPGQRWGFLPSVGLGWNISKEDWFNSKAINLLKLRGTIGKSAYADPANYYTYLQNYSVASTGYNFGATATAVAGSLQNSMNNPNITWEKSLKIDAGIEVEFLNHQFNIAMNYYNNKYVDELITPANGYASGIIGLGYPSVNAGKTRYYGYETSLGYSSNKDNDFNYFIKGNLSIAKNKIISRAEGNYPYSWMYRAGQPSATFGYEAIGFYQVGEDLSKTANIPGYTPSAGDIKYNDLNKDGIINFLDQKAIAGTKPLVFFGLNFGFNYKNFDFNALIESRVNREIAYSANSFLAFNNSYGNVLDFTTENRWTTQNPINASLPRLTLGTNIYNNQSSSFWIKRADYIRLKNAEIGYTIPTKLLAKAKINKLRVFVNGYNLFTASKLDYLDPETGLSGFANYRIINAGVSLKL